MDSIGAGGCGRRRRRRLARLVVALDKADEIMEIQKSIGVHLEDVAGTWAVERQPPKHGQRLDRQARVAIVEIEIDDIIELVILSFHEAVHQFSAVGSIGVGVRSSAEAKIEPSGVGRPKLATPGGANRGAKLEIGWLGYDHDDHIELVAIGWMAKLVAQTNLIDLSKLRKL